MKNPIFSSAKAFSFILILLSGDALCQEKEASFPSISIQGNDYLNSCSSVQKSDLRSNLYKEEILNKKEAWEILELLICASPTRANLTKILKSTKSKIKVESEATGEPEPHSELVNVNLKFIEGLLGRGQAWKAGVVVLHNTIKLQYFANEACVEERVLEFSQHKWKLVEAGQACD